MTQTLQLGPFVLSLPLLLAAAAFFLASFVARRVGQAQAANAERQLLRVVLVGVLAARLAFVLQYRDIYLKAPLGILDIRDGGWHAVAGLGVALIHAGVVLVRHPALRKPLGAALAVGTGAWIAAALVLTADAPSEVRMPQVDLLAMDGGTVALSAFQGRPTVVNLWATWCPPCQREMPVLHAAQASRRDVHFVFLNQGESAQQVAAYLLRSGLGLHNVLLDVGSQVGTTMGHRALPTTLFFDARGRLVDTRVGELSEASLAERLAALTASRTDP